MQAPTFLLPAQAPAGRDNNRPGPDSRVWGSLSFPGSHWGSVDRPVRGGLQSQQDLSDGGRNL